MNLNRAELRKIMYDFNSNSNRLLQADFHDHAKVVAKFVDYLKATPVIYDYILACGTCEQDMEKEFNEVGNSYGRCIFEIGKTDEEEVRNIFAILDYIAKNNIEVYYSIALGYDSSKYYQDKIKAFNNRVCLVLIRHIERYLTKIGIDMGLDERITYSISNNGQVNIAKDNATINAIINTCVDCDKLGKLIADVQKAAIGMPEDDKATLSDSLEVLDEQLKNEKPRKSFIRTAINGIKHLKWTAEFAAAVTALVQFVQTIF